ncbi:MAG: hypothetical protein R3B07_34385 [Polyangiaceae bacterium]
MQVWTQHAHLALVMSEQRVTNLRPQLGSKLRVRCHAQPVEQLQGFAVLGYQSLEDPLERVTLVRRSFALLGCPPGLRVLVFNQCPPCCYRCLIQP